MNILTEIHRSPGVDIHGRTVHRTAVRAVVLRGRVLLLIHSANVGDYKFPGGGVAEGESHAQALGREVREECGTSLACIHAEIGAVIEYDHAMEPEYDTFQMTSHYYECEVNDGFGEQKLDAYEQELGFQPVWIELDGAIQINRELLRSGARVEWLPREIFVLEYLERHLLPARNTGELDPAP
jgi:8-oxo-dGTP pyrophosphatase MutT (NUDIX family)